MRIRQPAVYILASKKNGTLYIGVTSELVARIWSHKTKQVEGFAVRYSTSLLVYFELHDSMYAALTREKQLKEWKRLWKLRLIEENNPNWADLFDSII